MIKTILLCGAVSSLFALSTHAQVGINTNTPVAGSVLHIDAGIQGNTTDDVVVDNQGRMGIATTTPTAKLHLKMPASGRSFVVEDGSQQEYKMLTSDTQGNALWKFSGLTVVKGVLSPTGKTYLANAIPDPLPAPRLLYPLDATITLPPGRWCVYTNLLISTSGADASDTYAKSTWIRLTYSDSNGGLVSADILNGSLLSSGSVYALPYGIVRGCSVIRNQSGAPKTYYLGIGYADPGAVSAGVQINNLANDGEEENGIIAVKIANN